MDARHLGLALALFGVAACGDDPSPAPQPPAVAVAGPVRQGNYDADRHVVAVPVRNTGPETITVTSVQLDSSRFRRLGPAARVDPIRPGQVVSLRFPYGTAVCPAPSPAHEDAVLQVQVGGGKARTARLAEAIPSALDEIHAEQCRQQEVAAGFAITLTTTGDPVLRRGKPTLPALLTIRRTGSRAPFVLAELRGSLLFDLLPDRPGDPVLDLRPDDPGGEVRLGLSVTQCDPHLLTEANSVFTFFLQTQLGDDPEPRPVRLDASPELQRQLLRLPPLCPKA